MTTMERPREETKNMAIRRRSSYFVRAFKRDKGVSDATLEVLRGTQGADFEGFARVELEQTGAARVVGCLKRWFSFRRLRKTTRYLLIKSTSIFVFASDAPNELPLYAISLQDVFTLFSEGSRIDLETSLGDVLYRIFLLDDKQTKEFITTVTTQSQVARINQTKKVLGHSLLTKRASTRFADAVGTEKKKDQPQLENTDDLDRVTMRLGTCELK